MVNEQIKMSYWKTKAVTSRPSETELDKTPPSWPKPEFTAPYISYAQDEFSSRVQRIFLLSAVYTKDVDLAKMASCGNVLGVWWEGHCPCIHYRGEQRKIKTKKKCLNLGITTMLFVCHFHKWTTTLIFFTHHQSENTKAADQTLAWQSAS